MSIATIKAGARFYKVTPDTANLPGAPFLELGPAQTISALSTMVVMFRPRQGWSGSFTVLGKSLGTAADDIDVPFVPVPYRVASLNNVAQLGYPWSADAITGTALIRVPASGLTLALEFSVSSGICDIISWDLMGDTGP